MANRPQVSFLEPWIDKETNIEYYDLEKLQKMLINAGKVKIKNFGIFEVRTIKQRETYNVGSGKGMVTVPEHKKIVFRPTIKFKQSVQ